MSEIPAQMTPARAALDRRAFLTGLMATGLAGCGSVLPLTVPPEADAYRIPLVDFHTHLQKRVTAEHLIRQMDEGNVARMVLMPLYYGDDHRGAVNDGEGSDEQALAYARRFPDRFVPFVGMQRGELVNAERWVAPDSVAYQLVLEAAEKLRSGQFFGMGEFMLRFYPYTTSQGIVAPSDMNYPADSYLMRLFADVGAKYHAPLVIHCEAEPAAGAAMVRLIEGHPQATIVWAHNCGRASAAQIREWMARYDNLYADLGHMASRTGYGGYWPRHTPWMHLIADVTGEIEAEMKALFEAFPDRFFIGTDTAHAHVYEFYAGRTIIWRPFLSQLTPATARKIAFENADRLFGA